MAALAGNLYHILWTCKSIRSFWRKIFQFISNISGILTAQNPGLAIINISLDSFPILYRNVIDNLLLSAKLTITRNWKEDLAPNPSEAVNMTQLHYSYKRAIVLYAGTLLAFDKKWKPWFDWLNN